MKEFIEKLIARLEEKAFEVQSKQGIKEPSTLDAMLEKFSVLEIKEIVNQLAEEYYENSPQKSADGWIPCSERLPGENGEYVVMVKYAEYPTVLDYLCGAWCDHNECYYEVVAWMPLPAPYTENKVSEIPTSWIEERFERVE